MSISYRSCDLNWNVCIEFDVNIIVLKNILDHDMSLKDSDKNELLYMMDAITPDMINNNRIINLVGSNMATYIKMYDTRFGISSTSTTIYYNKLWYRKMAVRSLITLTILAGIYSYL